MEKSVTCKRMGDSLEYRSQVEKWVPFKKWDILGKMGYNRKRGSNLENWVTPPVSSVIRNINFDYLR